MMAELYNYRDVLGFSSQEIEFLRTVANSGPFSAERNALQQAMAAASAVATLTLGAPPLFNTTQSTIAYSKDPDPDPDPPHGGDGGGPVDISPFFLFFGAVPFILLTALSAHLRLGLHHRMAIATIRCATQLSLLGYILVPIFITNRWWLTLVYSFFMLAVAAAEAVSRPAQAYDGMMFEVLMAMGIACACTITFGLACIVRVTPWYDSQYLIPMLGMLLGNSCSSVAVGLSAVLEEISGGKEKVEALLVLGATRVEATRDVVVRAARLALTPLLNSMNVVGIVSIPGMMTGNLLSGTSPSVAAHYQILIYFLVALSSSVSAVATIYAALLTICDNHHRLRSEKLKARASRTAGAFVWMWEQVREGGKGVGRGVVAVGKKAGRVFARLPAPRTRHRYSSYLQEAVEEGRGGREDLEQSLLNRSNAVPSPPPPPAAA